MFTSRRLRLLTTLTILASAAIVTPAWADEAPQPSHITIRLNADKISFYFDRYMVEADGHVRVTTSDGLTITGQTFSMDLRLNRFLVAGAVRVDAPTGSQTGAAIADFLDFHRTYFVPITPATGATQAEPDRWTFVDGDYAHPLKGREMPGDTFAFPDFANATAFLYARSAVISSGSYVRFGGATLTVNGAAVLPVGAYYIGLSADPHLARNSLSGATIDATFPFAGSSNAISALHVRNDPTNHTYASFEQHLASSKVYTVFSLNPATAPSKFYNLIAGYQPNGRFQITDFEQFHAYQYGFSQPFEAQHVSYVQAAQLVGNSALTFTYTLANFCLLHAYVVHTSPPFVACGTNGHATTQLNNLQQYSLGIISSDRRLFPGLPLRARYRYGFGAVHDTSVLQAFPTPATPYYTIWGHYVGATLYVPNIRLGDPNQPPIKSAYINLSLDAQREWYSVPHHVDSFDGIASLSHALNKTVSAYVAYEVANTGDYYNAGQQAVYPPFVPTIGQTPFPSYASFRGVSTLRTLSFGLNWVPDPNFSFSVLARKHRDFPIPEPDLFPAPPTNILGQYIYTSYLGQPPYDITGDLRFRVLPHVTIDMQRSYYFNFDSQHRNVGLVVQVLQ
jgi:hypothetical protein